MVLLASNGTKTGSSLQKRGFHPAKMHFLVHLITEISHPISDLNFLPPPHTEPYWQEASF